MKRLPLAAACAVAIALVALGAWEIAVRVGRFPVERLSPSTAASLLVLDRAGGVLRQTAGAAGGRQRWVRLDRIAPALVDATLAAEDHRFREHGGVDPVGIARAAWLNLRRARAAFGGSTITMQLVRLVDGRRGRVGVGGKLREALAAARLERAVGKDEILTQYLNRAYYGNGAFGAEAAARLYFGKSAATLSVGEAALLAVLPRGPRLYDPHRHLPRALDRRDHVLSRMVALGALSAADARLARETPLALRREVPELRASHFVEHTLAAIPAAEHAGAVVETTLDAPLQQRLEVAVREHLASVGGRRITQAGVVVLRNDDGAILAMVGSADYFDAARAGAVNAVTARRRPGSTLKPFVYALALEAGDTPATIALDVVLPHEVRAPWTADVRQHGFGRYREALAGSYNLAAVHTLARVGPAALAERLRLAGLTTLTAPSYDLALAIGDAEVTLLELTAAFAAFGTGGFPVRPRAIERLTLAGGTAVPPPRARAAIVSPDVAYLIFDMLSDPDARRPMFGSAAPMHLPFPVALKTGTTRAYTDNLALATTAEYTVGAWAGNFDGTPTEGMMAMQGAAPLARAAFTALAARFGQPTAPPRPANVLDEDVCPLSGLRPGPHCPTRKRELFVDGTAPRAACDWHVHRCGRVEIAYPDAVRPWARATGRTPRAPCEADGGVPLRIVYPADGARFALDPYRPVAHQLPPLHALPTDGRVRWSVDGVPVARFRPTAGEHVVRAELGAQSDEVTIRFDD